MTDAAAQRLQRYVDLVTTASDKLNLTGPGELSRFRTRHVTDSLRLLPLLKELPQGPAIDVGSGAGLPGIPLAISEPERVWRLLEPRRKRVAFLEDVVRQLDLKNCEVLAFSAEEAARRDDLRAGHALAVARALAPPARALALARPLVARGGEVMIFVGVGGEIPAEAEEWGEGFARLRVV
jgi:16S rRNA (guanine527-N7)-methyltransferase